MSLVKLAKKITLDIKHIKEDSEKFKKIQKIVGSMQSEDKEVLKKHASLIKIAVPGPGFAALERIGLAGKAMATHAGSDWLKNAPAKVAPVMSLIKLAKTHYKMKDLQKYRTELTKSELDEVFKRKAVWHHGQNGEETSAIWKAQVFDNLKSCKPEFTYITNTHRAMATSPTLKGAINKYHSFIKGTA